jgi:hypothetical protein
MVAALDIFMAFGVGILFIFLSLPYGKYMLGAAENPYPEIKGTGFVWPQGTPKAGQEVTPEELQPEPKKVYQATIDGRKAAILGDSSVFLFGGAMLVAGLLMVVSRLGAVPLVGRKIASGAGIAITAAGLLYGAWAIVGMLRFGITPLVTMVAVLVGGMSLFMQVAGFRSLSGAPIPQRRRVIADRGAPIAAGALPSSPARIAHHRFAHQMLRQEIFANPMRAVGLLQGPGGRLHLAELWDRQSEAVGLSLAQNPPDGLHAEMTQVGPYSAAIVTMPPPQREGEAHFVGIVLRSYVRQDGAVIERQPVVLYYTLEMGNTGPASAVLCEWQAGDHIRFADVVSPQFSAFREAMWQKVQSRQTAEDQMAAQPRA